MKKLTLKQERISKNPYKVIVVRNSTEWNVGQRLTRDEVQELVAQKVDVKII